MRRFFTLFWIFLSSSLSGITAEMAELWKVSLETESDPAVEQILKYNIGAYYLMKGNLSEATSYLDKIEGPPFYSINVQELLLLSRAKLIFKESEKYLSENPQDVQSPILNRLEEQIKILESSRLEKFPNEELVELLFLLRQQRSLIRSSQAAFRFQNQTLLEQFNSIRDAFSRAVLLAKQVPEKYLLRYLRVQPFFQIEQNQAANSLLPTTRDRKWPAIYIHLAPHVYRDTMLLINKLVGEMEEGKGLNPYLWNQVQLYLYIGQTLSEGKDPLRQLLSSKETLQALPLMDKGSDLTLLFQATDYLFNLYSQFNNFRLTDQREELSFYAAVLLFKESKQIFKSQRKIPNLQTYLWIKQSISGHFESLLTMTRRSLHSGSKIREEIQILWKKLELVIPFFKHESLDLHTVLDPLGQILSDSNLSRSQVEELVLTSYVQWDLIEALKKEFQFFQNELLLDIEDGVFDYLKNLQSLIQLINEKIVRKGHHQELILFPDYYYWIDTSLDIFNEDPSGGLSKSILAYLLESFDRLNRQLDEQNEKDAIRNWIHSLDRQIKVVEQSRPNRSLLPNFFVNSESIYSKWLSFQLADQIERGSKDQKMIDAFNALIRLQKTLKSQSVTPGQLIEEYTYIKELLEDSQEDQQESKSSQEPPPSSQINQANQPAKEKLIQMQQADQEIERSPSKSMYQLESPLW